MIKASIEIAIATIAAKHRIVQVLGEESMPPFNSRVLWRARARIEADKIPKELQSEECTSMWWFEGGSVRLLYLVHCICWKQRKVRHPHPSPTVCGQANVPRVQNIPHGIYLDGQRPPGHDSGGGRVCKPRCPEALGDGGKHRQQLARAVPPSVYPRGSVSSNSAADAGRQ